ncbi:MAG: DUF58 domain-containing protein [Candidatus Ranarchaeia archaeon]
MISRRGTTLVLLGIFLLTSGFAFSNYFLVLISSLLILSVVVGLPLFEIQSDVDKIIVERKLDKVKIFADDFVNVTLTIKNKGHRSIDFLRINDGFPNTFECVVGQNQIETSLGSGKSKTYSYILQARLRGEYEIGPTRLLLHDRLGFHFLERKIPTSTNLLVYPTYEDVRRMEAAGKSRRLGLIFGSHKTKIKGIGTDFYGIRQYTPSDGMRFIDWKSSARTGKMMTREFETEKNIRVVMIIDTSSTMTAGRVENSKLEYGIRSAVLLSKIALERRDLVGVFAGSTKVQCWVEPKAGKNHFYTVLENLATVQAQGGSHLHSATDYVVKRTNRSSYFIFVTDLEAPKKEIIEAIKLAKIYKHQVLVIAPFGPWFESQAGSMSPIEKALSESISIRLYEKRKSLSRSLRRMGVDVVDVGPDDFLPTVINVYMAAKQKQVATG